MQVLLEHSWPGEIKGSGASFDQLSQGDFICG